MALRQLCSDKQQRSCKAARLPPVWLGKPCRPRHSQRGRACAASQPAAEPAPTPTLCRHPGKRRALLRCGATTPTPPAVPRAGTRKLLLETRLQASNRPHRPPGKGSSFCSPSRDAGNRQTVLPSQTILPLPSDAVALHAGQGQTCCPGACSGFYRH